jgi:mono/diheme cytochrome c family protein
MRTFVAAAMALALFIPALAGLRTAARAEADPKPYHVENGLVDQPTFNGYRRYGESCLRCHGPDGAGSSYAPSLLDSLKNLDHDQFAAIVIQGRQNVTTSNSNVMPSFGTTEDVVLYLDDIYGYLKASSDGALGRGRPKRVGDD